MPALQSICVFCGSSPGAHPAFLSTAKDVGKFLAQSNLRLIYGGGSVGLMGAVADACLEHGGQVTGVMTRQLIDLEVGHEGLTQLEVVETMHERKARMAELADGFVVLPGGIGTLEEMFEILTWSQLEIHSKPLGLLNIEHYFDALCDFLKHMVDQRFMLREHGEMLLVESDVATLFGRLKHYQPVRLEKWVERKTSGNG